MERGNPGIKLLTILGLALVGMILVAIFSGLCVFIVEGSLANTKLAFETGSFMKNPILARTLLLIQHLGTFILPAIIFGTIYYGKEIWEGFNLKILPNWKIALLGIVFIFIALPLVNLSFLLNEQIDLPAWATMAQSQTDELLSDILQMDHFGIFVINFLLIAVMPGIGEELIFRGIIQKYMGRFVNSPIAGIWISAIIFSAIHMQFEGFFPRIALGAILGYLYYWTNNLWVPILAHTLNNGLQVAMVYFSDIDPSKIETSPAAVTWWMIIGSVGLMFLIAQFIQNEKGRDVGVA